MKLKRPFLLLAVLSLFLIACSDNDDKHLGVEKTAVSFSSSISGNVRPMSNGMQTRALGGTWDVNDKIGIYMLKSKETPGPGSIVDGIENVGYITSGSGYFNAMNESQIIYFPEEDYNVDFIAYYPLDLEVVDFKYSIDLSDQSIQKDIDILYSNSSKGLNSSNNTVNLSFTHPLSRLELRVSAGQGLQDLSDLSVEVKGLDTKGEFDLTDASLTVEDSAKDIVAHTTAIGNTDALVEVVLFPSAAKSGRKVVFKRSNGRSVSWEIPSDLTFEKGRKYVYNISLGDSDIEPEPNHGWLELPTIQDMPNTVVVKHAMPHIPDTRNYTMLYDLEHKFAYWVAYPLHVSHFPGSRGDAWGFDPSVARESQPTLKRGWGAGTGLDRGHQLPSGDRTSSPAANATTFYYTNMTAQSSVLNQNWWRILETQVREWTSASPKDTMYVVTGAMIDPNNFETVPDNDGKLITKPAYYFKALAQRKSDNKMHTIAFKINNEDKKGNDIEAYQMSVKQLEMETGFNFFPNLDASAKESVDKSKWGKTVRSMDITPYNRILND